MHSALLKKYFRLAVRLLKFKACKNFLNSKPTEDDQSFLFMQQMHLKEKKDLYKNLELEKRLNQSKTNDDVITDMPGKIVDLSGIEEINNKLKKFKNGTTNLKDGTDLLRIEDNYERSLVNSSSLYSSKLSKFNKYNSFDDIDLDKKRNLILEEKFIEIKNFGKSNYSHRDNVSDRFRDSFDNKVNNFHSEYYENQSFLKLIDKEPEKNKPFEGKIKGKKKIQINEKSQLIEADRDSLFNPENTKNKRNLNEEIDSNNSFSSLAINKNNPHLLILRENEVKKDFNEHEELNNSYLRKKEEQGILAHIEPSSKFGANFKIEEENIIINKSNSLKLNKNNENKSDDSIKNFKYMNLEDSKIENNNFNKIQAQNSFRKIEEENRVNSDFMINVQLILIDNLRYIVTK